MEKTICNKTLQSGKRCKNKAKHGNYCGVHIHKCGAFPLLELHENLVSHIIQFVTDPNDLINFAFVSSRIKFLIALHMERMIKCELPRAYPFYIDLHNIAESNSIRKKWKYLLFLAIGGLFINFKSAGHNKFYFNNKIISLEIDNKMWFTKSNNTRALPSINNDECVFIIRVKEITRTIFYNTIFRTTNFDKIEYFFGSKL